MSNNNNNNINIKVKTSSKLARESLHDLSKSFVVLGKDGKRANTSVMGLTRSFGNMGRVIKGIGLYKLAQGLTSATQSAVDITESIHMYNIAMGDFAESTGEAIDKLSELTGLDRTRLADTVGEYNLLARSMGMTAKNASILSENTNRLALDLSALSNRSVTKVAEDLRSGLIGQSKTMYKYGIDVTEAAIKQEALNQGISKSVRHMSQAEKMALRYAVMIRQSALSHGDFANTIERPANQLRVFSDRMLTLTRTIGTIFVPMLTKVMPYLNAFAKVLTRIIAMIAKLVGYDGSKNESWKNTGDQFGGISEDIEDIGGNADKSGKKVDKLKKKIQALAGFDELNILGQKIPDTPEVGSGGSSGDLGGGALDLDLEGYDSMLDQLTSKTDEIVANIEAQLSKIVEFMKPTTEAFKTLWDEGLSKLMGFTFGTLTDFYNSFLKPMTKWVMGKGLIQLFEITNDLLNGINWDSLQNSLKGLYMALLPLGKFIGQGLIDFYKNFLVPVATWVFNVALDKLVNALRKGLMSINYDTLSEGLNRLWDALSKYTINVGEGLLWILTDVLIPLGVWAMNEIAPVFLDLLTATFTVLNTVLDTIKPTLIWLWEEFLLPIAQWTGGVIVETLGWIVEKLESLGEWIVNNEKLVEIMTVFGATFTIVIGLVAGLTGAINILSPVVGALSGVFGFLLSPIGLITLAVSGLITTFVLLYKNNEDFRDKVGNIWESIKNIFSTVTSSISDIVKSTFDSIKEFWDNHGKSIKETASKVWEFVYTTIKDKIESVMKIVTSVYTKVKEFWNKNGEDIKIITGAIWKKVSEVIKTVMEGIQKVITTIYDAVKNYWDKHGETISKMTSTVWETIKKLIDVALNIISGLITAFAGLVSGDWDKFGEGMKKIWSAVWEGIKTIVGGAWNLMSGVFGSLKTSISGWFDNIVKSGKDWGRNLIMGFADGIKDSVSRVTDAVRGVANTVGDFIGFRSPTKKGVGRDADKWMPNMMNMFADGIEDNRYKIAHSMEMTVGDIGSGVKFNNSDIMGSITSAISNSIPKNDPNNGGGIIIQIGERTILDTLTDGVNRENRINGKSIIRV